MKIAIIQLPHFYGGGLSRLPSEFPLGLGYIASILENHGVEYKVFDFWDMQLPAQLAAKFITESDYDAFGISSYSTQYNYLKEFSNLLKKKFPKIPILCGGAGATFSSDIILKHTGVDICVISEGEVTLIDLLYNIKNPGNVKGITYIDSDGKIIYTGNRPYVKDLSELPFPNRRIVNFEKYLKNSNTGLRKGLRTTNVITARGCPYKCNFCSKTFSGCRLRSVDNVIEEIRYLKDEFRIECIGFHDELTIVNKKRTLELCKGLKNLKIKWTCQGRINMVDREILAVMKESGCLGIGYGIESVSQTILDNMNKKINVDDIVSVIDLTKRIGIKPIIQYMYGYPGENDETIRETENFFKKIDHLYIGSPTTPIPGTILYDQAIENGLIGDEEDYLLRLDSGYNLVGETVNMTDFTDEEYIVKHRKLNKRINFFYYRRHPIKWFIKLFSRTKYVLTLIFKKPRYVIRKLRERARVSMSMNTCITLLKIMRRIFS